MADYEDTYEYMRHNYEEVNGYDLYTELFPDCEESGDMHMDYSHPNAIFLYDDKEMGKLRRRIMLSDTWEEDYMNLIEENDLTLCSGLVYRGKSNKLEHAQRMNALIFDVDGVGLDELKTMEDRWEVEAGKYGAIPKPTFLVLSGSGVHCYYQLEEPIDLYPNIKLQLKSLKYDLTAVLWRYEETSKEESIQRQSINQSFRMPGSLNNKMDPKRHVVAFRVGDKVSVDYLNNYVLEEENKVDLQKPFKPTKRTLAQAKESFPEWYERVVVQKNRKPKKWMIDEKVHGEDPYALYHWWIRQKNKIKGGHRYYFLMCMSIYASKCNYPRERLVAEMKDIFDEIAAIKHKNELTKDDMKSALEAFSKEYYDTSINEINYWTNVGIEKNKRNYRDRNRHLEIARDDKKNMKEKGKAFKNPEGRPSMEKRVREWRKENPEGNKSSCASDLKISRQTVYKWWDS